MGNASGSLKKHIETAEKTGALNFTDRGLEKFPADLVQVTGKLRTLDLSANKISQLPANIGAFKQLKNLNVSRNRISELPTSFGQLTKLEMLNVATNALTRIPPAILSPLKNLREIHLAGNALVDFPLGLCGLKHLNIVNLTGNRITSVPDGVNGIEATELILNQNQIAQVSGDLAACARLKTLRLEENCLTLEALPSALFTDSGLSLIALDGNLFDTKRLDTLPGYDAYMERYTAVKRKLD